MPSDAIRTNFSRVFIVQESRYTRPDGSTATHDYSSLHVYGHLVFMLSPSRKQAEERKMTELAMLQAAMAEYNPRRDYLVFSGDPVLCAQAAIVAFSMTDDECSALTVLKWNKAAKNYQPVALELPT